MEKRVLVVDDESKMCSLLERIIKSHGDFTVFTATNGFDALDILEGFYIDLVLTDVRMPDMDGAELLLEIKKRYPEAPVVMITAYGTIKSAVEAMKMGAYDYITKPFREAEITAVVDRVLERFKLRENNIRLVQEIQELIGNSIVGTSPAIEEVFDFIRKVAPSESTVLITGESGTGKELVARAIHYLSPRQGEKFLAVNCSALAENLLESELFGHAKGSFTGAVRDRRGLFEEVDGGTVFLDEIGEVSFAMQAKLLRVLEGGEFYRVGDTQPRTADFRLITATNRDLAGRVRAGAFREDLYYRLNVLTVRLPTLRERKEDIPLLVNHFLKKFRDSIGAHVRGVSPETVKTLVNYDWPGNVRELENVLERAIVLSDGDMIEPCDILVDMDLEEEKADLYKNGSLFKRSYKEARKAAINEFNREYITRALLATDGNVTRASSSSGIERQYFQMLMRRAGIRSSAYRVKKTE